MINYQVQFHGDIARDYNEAYNWYEDQQPDLGKKFLAAVRQTITRLSAQPEAYGAKTNELSGNCSTKISICDRIQNIQKGPGDLYFFSTSSQKASEEEVPEVTIC